MWSLDKHKDSDHSEVFTVFASTDSMTSAEEKKMKNKIISSWFKIGVVNETSVEEPHHFYAAPGKNFDAAPAPLALLLPYYIPIQLL
jgi:hypothetical protein